MFRFLGTAFIRRTSSQSLLFGTLSMAKWTSRAKVCIIYSLESLISITSTPKPYPPKNGEGSEPFLSGDIEISKAARNY